jgi:hypothetical protein
MIKIGIEINNVIRDYNKQFVKYFKKAIDPLLDDKAIDIDNVNITDILKFSSKLEQNNFIYTDYPYEIFGCANPVHRNLPTKLNGWIQDMSNIEDEEYKVVLFGLLEQALSIQSTYYFLSKIGSRARQVMFPENGADMWNECDVIITTNPNIIENKPDGKKVILIEKSYNTHLKDKSILQYNSLMDLIEDNNFFDKIK